MLNIPDEVKALFKSDSVFKNFHVNFPNGEHTDLNNDDVISESVSFTESICSKDVFQFGLSERPSIEFECVNVPNIYGVTIYCAIEICVDSLGAQWISDHQPVGTEKWLDPQVCTYGARNMYRIPYGSFIVQSCPRSHGAMWRRRVTAYGKAPQDIRLSSFLSRKYSIDFIMPETIEQNPFGIIADSTNSVDWIQTTRTQLSPTQGISPMSVRIPVGQNYYLHLEETYLVEYLDVATYPANYIFRIDTYPLNTLRNSVLTDLKARGLSVPNYDRGIGIDPYDIVFDKYFFPSVEYTVGNLGQNLKGTSIITRDTKYAITYFYPYLPMPTALVGPDVIIPRNITTCVLEERNGSVYTTVYNYGTGMPLAQNDLYSYEITDQYASLALIGVKGSGKYTFNGEQLYSYLNSIDMPSLYNGVFELLGSFRKTGRTGKDETIVLSNAIPYAITPDQYSELWYDDFIVDNIGTILLTYNDAEEKQEQTITYPVGNGASVYDMTSNYLLKNLYVTVSDVSDTIKNYVLHLLDTFFIPNIGAVTFLPSDMTALNIPYYEPGDYIEIDNGDNGTVETFILARTIDGIQTLYDSVEANSGKLDGEG